VFALQKYQFDARETNYLTLTNQLQEGYVSSRLQEFCAYYSNRISYEEVALLVERMSGERLLSDQKIGQIVSDTALKISQEIHKNTIATLGKVDERVVKINSQVEIYNSQVKEILLFEDGIQVKVQKAHRQPKAKLKEEKTNQFPSEPKSSAMSTDIVLLQKNTGGFEYIAAPITTDGKNLLSLTDVVKAFVIQEYGKEVASLNLVAVTDGAKVIRHRLLTIFDGAVTVILDWYHLCKKVRELLSMIAINKLEKAQHLKFLLSQGRA